MEHNLNVDFTKMSKYEIIAHLAEMKAELRERLGALRNDRLLRDVRKHPKGKTIAKIQLIKEVLGVDK